VARNWDQKCATFCTTPNLPLLGWNLEFRDRKMVNRSHSRTPDLLVFEDFDSANLFRLRNGNTNTLSATFPVR
jgi:hypothetical protein